MIQIPQGFRLAAANADFRGKKLGRSDLGLVVSDTPAVAAGVFTTNLFRAAPVLVSQEHLSRGHDRIRAIVVNSGQANACTGEQGLENCRLSLRLVSDALAKTGVSVPPEAMLPASTGVIGAHMDMEKWAAAVPALAASLGQVDVEGLVRAMMTTDAFPKMAGRELALPGGTVRLAGVAKGAGMICPNMATMISLVLCDAAVDAAAWADMFRRAADATFNRVSVDGDTSTNDSLYGLANGASGVRVCEAGLPLLEKALTEVLGELAYMLVKDGEGATKVMHIHVTGAATDEDAEKVARTVGHSQLVKTAMFGRDPNWGRIVAAAGRAGVNFDPLALRVTLCGVELFRSGRPTDLDFDALLEEPLKAVDLPLDISLGDGHGEARLLAADLSHAYVSLNSDYRS
ncbi:bifunctional glutamate N-acetyltransferase/amino-acid acetyltransferase ArgJ [uncultured Mailhella sp.]|uniref:bifunctional glutamate N-acetyltransferase/amino-acid acetyltransferase ArgJ n=1 Tax=uncultured Mailhella sp. TaxID=1981031 RepID=UPI00262D0F10|nr:bifunctional glutamate N-acetyltransferase/amino-acid acetyltransferase ArgJ [uncultured Mailhella sp.]